MRILVQILKLGLFLMSKPTWVDDQEEDMNDAGPTAFDHGSHIGKLYFTTCC